MITRVAKIALALAFLSACAAPAPLTGPPVLVTGEGPEDVYAATRQANPQAPAYRGRSGFVLRTFADGPKLGDRVEAPAECIVDGDGLFSVTVTTPVRLVAPNYGPRTPALTARCSAGALSGGGTHRVYNRTAALDDARYRIDPPGLYRGRRIWRVLPPPLRDPDSDVFAFRDWSITLR